MSNILRNRIFVPSVGTESWRALLADPTKHWKGGYSAMSLAECWESADGRLPKEVSGLLGTHSETSGARLVLALPELQVALPGGNRPTQTDVFALVSSMGGLIACAIEGKVDEDFGPTVTAKRAAGATERLAALHKLLEIPEQASGDLRYQLFHRTAASILLAKEFSAPMAALVVHSFSSAHSRFSDFRAFASALGAAAQPDRLAAVGVRDGVRLFVGWATGTVPFHRQESA